MNRSIGVKRKPSKLLKAVIGMIIFMLAFPFDSFPAPPRHPLKPPASVPSAPMEVVDSLLQSDDIERFAADSILESEEPHEEIAIDASDLQRSIIVLDSLVVVEVVEDEWVERDSVFNPDPNRAVWLSALFPGLGQIYNRSYWKLPIVVGGFMGLGYATSWNNGMLKDYTRAYRDITDSDPSTNSYMNFFPSTTKEEDLDKTWLTNLLKSRKDYFRRNRDLCIICMVGVYLIAMVDAYVDASLAHFDISPDLSLNIAPAVIQDTRGTLPSVGIQWALNF